MMPMLKVSGPLEPERITAGSATEPCSTFPVRLNCCCRMVDLGKNIQHRISELLQIEFCQLFFLQYLNYISQHLEKLENVMVFLSNHFLTQQKKDNLGLPADQLLIALMSRHQGNMELGSFVTQYNSFTPFRCMADRTSARFTAQQLLRFSCITG